MVPARRWASVSDPTGDAFYSANGSRTPAGDNLDLTGASLANGANKTLVAKINVKSLASLNVGTGARRPRRELADPLDGRHSGNDRQRRHLLRRHGQQRARGSGAPTFFAGDTTPIPVNNPAEHTKYFAYPQTHTLSASQASYDKSTRRDHAHRAPVRCRQPR